MLFVAQRKARLLLDRGLFALRIHFVRLAMIRYPPESNRPGKGKDRMDERAPEQDQDADDEAEILRQLGHDLLPFNGGDRSCDE